MASCRQHLFETATAVCCDCSDDICSDCTVTVHPIGTMCRSCALVRAGVRAKRRR